MALWFLAFIGLRLIGSFVPRLPQKKMRRLPDRQLPVYTVIAALYREAKSVGPLMQAIDAFDYPREKLQVILALEPNDLATRAAIARLGPMPHVQVLIASAAGPQTKPKALNCALPFARGSFTAVFDAEDRPDPGQLRAALDAFRSHDTDVACAQASLCIDNNNEDSWLSRTFAAEYAGQFDVFLPGLAAMRMPLPLGGSSNHFRSPPPLPFPLSPSPLLPLPSPRPPPSRAPRVRRRPVVSRTRARVRSRPPPRFCGGVGPLRARVRPPASSPRPGAPWPAVASCGGAASLSASLPCVCALVCVPRSRRPCATFFRAACIAVRLFRVGSRRPLSKSRTVETPTLALASASWARFSQLGRLDTVPAHYAKVTT